MIGRAAVIFALALAGVFAPVAAAAPPVAIFGPSVMLSATGPAPSPVTVHAGEGLSFVKSAWDQASEIVFDSAPCDVTVDDPDLLYRAVPRCSVELPYRPNDECGVPFGPVLASTGCAPIVLGGVRLWSVGSFTYRVNGFGAGTGTVVVVPSGRIKAGRETITYGKSDLLWGSFLPFNAYPGQPWTGDEIGVTLLARPFGEAFLTPIAGTVTHAAIWGLHVRPEIETTYRLSYVDDWTTGRTEDIVVHVRPKVTLRRLGRAKFFVHVAARKPYTGKDVDVQRLIGGGWTTIQSVPLTYHSSARFGLKGVPRPTRIRVAVAERPGYLTGVSRGISLGS